MHLAAQRRAALPVHSREARYHLVPTRISLRLGVLGETLLLVGSLGLRRIERFEIFGLELSLLFVPYIVAIGLLDLGNLLLHRIKTRFVILLGLFVVRLVLGGRDLDVFALGRREDGLEPVIVSLQDGI